MTTPADELHDTPAQEPALPPRPQETQPAPPAEAHGPDTHTEAPAPPTEPLHPAIAPLKAMFPDFDDAVMLSILESVNYNQDAAVDVLLGMSDPSYVSTQHHEVHLPPCSVMCAVSCLRRRWVCRSIPRPSHRSWIWTSSLRGSSNLRTTMLRNSEREVNLGSPAGTLRTRVRTKAKARASRLKEIKLKASKVMAQISRRLRRRCLKWPRVRPS